MYDSPPGLRRGYTGVSFVIGLLVGAAVAGGVLWFTVLEKQRAATEAERAAAIAAREEAEKALKNAKIRQEDLAPIQGLFPGADLVKKPAKETKTKDGKVLTEEEVKVHDLCQGFIEDVEAKRLLAAYRVTSKNYQTKTPRMKFDEMIDKVKLLPALKQRIVTREFRIRSSPGGKGYDFGYTITSGTSNQAVSFVLLVSKGEGDEWRIDDVEITQTEK
jgi:hypothetical protein